MFWPFTVWKNCSSDLKNFLTVGQNNFGNKIPFPAKLQKFWILRDCMIILPKNYYFAQKKLSGCRAHFPGTFVTLKHWTAIAKLQKHQNAFENHVFFSIFQQENRARKVGKNPMKNWFLIGSCHLSFKLNLVSLWLHKISE